MNEFEKHIRSQKEEMDTNDFTVEIWERMEKELPKKKNAKVISLWWTSAAAAIILIVFFIGNLQKGDSLSPAEFLAVNGINSTEYVTTLDKKMEVLKTLEVPVDQKVDFENIINQLNALDKEYLEYLEYIEQNGYQESVGERILEYYKTKIMMLDKIQQQIKEINYYEKKYNKQSKTAPLFL